MDPSNIDFARHVLAELESLFAKGQIEVKVRRHRGSVVPGGEIEIDPAVMVIDTKTGEQIIEKRFPSQIQNKAAALLSLLKGKKIS